MTKTNAANAGKPPIFGEVPGNCNACGRSFSTVAVAYDASLQGVGWGWFCHACFQARKGKLGIGRGQKYKYLRPNDLKCGHDNRLVGKWLQVAGGSGGPLPIHDPGRPAELFPSFSLSSPEELAELDEILSHGHVRLHGNARQVARIFRETHYVGTVVLFTAFPAGVVSMELPPYIRVCLAESSQDSSCEMHLKTQKIWRVPLTDPRTSSPAFKEEPIAPLDESHAAGAEPESPTAGNPEATAFENLGVRLTGNGDESAMDHDLPQPGDDMEPGYHPPQSAAERCVQEPPPEEGPYDPRFGLNQTMNREQNRKG